MGDFFGEVLVKERTMLIVGTQALKARGVKLGRQPRDTDLIATQAEFEKYLAHNDFKKTRQLSEDKHVVFHENGTIKEFEIARPNTAAMMLLERSKVVDVGVQTASPAVVYALKLSHRYLKNSPHFRKTMDDILALRGLGFSVPPDLEGAWMKQREKETYVYSHPKLNQGKSSFFSGDGVDYKYEHDDIHAALATIEEDGAYYPGDPKYTHPAYWYFQGPDAEVKVSREKWDRLVNWMYHDVKWGRHVQLSSVLEESYVLALERSQIPNDFSLPPRTSFLMALEKVCTSITSGWWREFAWENYYQVLGMYSDDYVTRFKVALAQGKIRPYNGKGS